ncbi:homeobox protein unc-4 homolog [Varanus komodoensis]|uniref:homeobox protein unc-4 homolog n=1 Tax=Varanus komodoensis TaxID=61221 RepID=UPI001CF77743|nr:homeobox protein unc-4 homolog [Varanus komodoensis]
MMDSRLPEHPHAQFGGMVGFPYPLGHPHVYELAGHQLQSAAAAAAAASVPFSIDGLLNGSCAASVVNPAPLIPSGCGVGGDGQPFKLSDHAHLMTRSHISSGVVDPGPAGTLPPALLTSWDSLTLLKLPLSLAANFIAAGKEWKAAANVQQQPMSYEASWAGLLSYGNDDPFP